MGHQGPDPRTEQELEIPGSHRMTQGGRLLVIFSRGSPSMALRMASMSYRAEMGNGVMYYFRGMVNQGYS